MSHYIWDKVLEPPAVPLTEIDKELDISEKIYVEELFTTGKLSSVWRVVYRQKTLDKDHMFLCTNWAFHRAVNDLPDGATFPPKEKPIDSTGFTVEKFVAEVKLHKLEPCDKNDPKCIAIAWCNGKPSPKARVAHIQVKHEDRWESKISTAPFVITHGVDDFSYYENASYHLQQAAWYKKIK